MTGSGEMNLDHIKVVACPGVALTAVVNLAEESWVWLIHGRRTSEGAGSGLGASLGDMEWPEDSRECPGSHMIQAT